MYSISLLTHSYLRWLLLGLALLVIVRAFVGWRGRREWLPLDEKSHSAFIGILNVQFLLGLVLYVFLSPVTSAFFSNLPASMKVSGLRFFGLEHVFLTVIAVAVAHIGRARMKRAAQAPLKHKRAFVSTLSALLLMLIAIPWPFMHAPRPLFRGGEPTRISPTRKPQGSFHVFVRSATARGECARRTQGG